MDKQDQFYFFDRDRSGHWYLVDANFRAEWKTWTELDEDDERAWEAPSFARRLSCHLSLVEFQHPIDKEG